MTYFSDYLSQILKEQLGETGEDLFKKIMTKKPINEKSTHGELRVIIKLIENIVTKIDTQEKAGEIGRLLNQKLNEIIESEKKAAVDKIDLKKVEVDIEDFIHQNSIPTESNISDFAGYLATKFGRDAKELRKEITEKIRKRIKDLITKDKINIQIDKFLNMYPEPTKTDVDDFLLYLTMQHLTFDEDYLRKQIESIRLFRKFRSEDEVVATEFDKFLQTIRSSNDLVSIGKAMEEQELSYLIKDDSGLLDNTLSEFIDLATPKEDDMKGMLKGLGLDHMLKKK